MVAGVDDTMDVVEEKHLSQVLLAAEMDQPSPWVGVYGLIQLGDWRKVLDEHGKPTGQLQRVKNRRLDEVARDLRDALEKDDLIDEYFHGPGTGEEHRRVPNHYVCVASYAVTGGSEGHYIHVEFQYRPADGWNRNGPLMVRRVALGKTFKGWEHAWKIAAKCAELLGA